MRPLFFFLLCFILPLISADLSWKMMFIYGEVEELSKEPIRDISWEQCYSICYYGYNCVVAYHSSSGCQFYDFGSVQVRKVDKFQKKLIAIKRKFEDEQCPLESENPLLSTSGSVSDIWVNGGILYNNTIEANGTNLMITYSRFECSSDSKLFQRDSVYVCIGLRLFVVSQRCDSYEKAKELCSSDGWLTITGPRGTEELQFFLGEIKRFGVSDGRMAWVDGANNNFLDETIGGSDYYPKCDGGDYNDFNYPYINYPPCRQVRSTKLDGKCFTGAVCRKELTKID